MKNRIAGLERKTRETDISIEINLDGSGESKIKTGIAFMDHMLELLSKHSLIDMKIRAKGDIEVDYHHTVEDIGLALGTALNQALGDRKGIGRYGWCMLPMDEAISRVAIDLGGRPYLVLKMATKSKKILKFDLLLIEEFLRAFVTNARMNLHVEQAYGQEPHHACESIFKGIARSLRQACEPDRRCKGVPSSKGKI